jgi:hypothetical protein
MRSILTVPAWKILLSFIAGVFSAEIIAWTFARYFNWNTEYGLYPTVRYALIILVWWTYPYLVGRALGRLAGKEKAGRQILLIILIAIVNNVFSVYYTETNGPAWQGILITSLINVYCIIAIFSFPARELKSIELGRRPYFYEILRELLQFMLWPLCAWRLQGRLTAISTQREAKSQALT